MIETTALARPYALAAYEQAVTESSMHGWSSALGFLAAVVADRAMAETIANPRVDDASLTELLLDVAEDRFSDTQANLVRLLVENGRLSLAPAIFELFEKERITSEGRATVSIISAFDLDDKQRELVTAAMAKRLGREVDLEESVDNELIGGVVIRTGDVVIDASLRGRLRQLEAEFL